MDTIIKKLTNKKAKWLVTGSAGFIGSNISEFLIKHDQQVTGIDNYINGKPSNTIYLESKASEYSNNFVFKEADLKI